jgi:transcriptional regulator with XRE-family HTH domain
MAAAATPRAKARGEESEKTKLTRQMRREAGRWLSGKREAAGMTQAQVADQIGYRYYTFVSQVEGGHGRVPSEHFEPWAKAVGVPTQEFAKKLLSYYEPEIHRLLYPGES